MINVLLLFAVQLSFAQFSLCKEPKSTNITKPEYSIMNSCNRYYSLLFTYFKCRDNFTISYKNGFLFEKNLQKPSSNVFITTDEVILSFQKPRKISEIVLKCLQNNTIKIPQDAFGAERGPVKFKINIANCDIDSKFIRKFKSAISFASAQSELKLYFFGYENTVMNFENETLVDLETCSLLQIMYQNVMDLPTGLFPISVQFLQVSYSNLTTLPEGLFESTIKLERLDLSQNKLKHLPHGIFRNLNVLSVLSLERNQLTNLDMGLFHGLKQLRNLYLSYNMIHTLPDNIFIDLVNLVSLDLNDNLFTTINKLAFVGAKSLRIVRMQSCKIEFLEPDIFESLASLNAFDISNNSVQIPEKIKYPPKMSILSLSHNNVPSIINETKFSNISSVVYLMMRDCGIHSIPSDFLVGAIKLKGLYLGANFIEELPISFLSDCNNLRILEIDHNNISQIHPNILQNKKLEYLYINDNRLSLIDKYTFKNLTYLIKLDLSHNRIIYIDSQAFTDLRKLTTLNISHNHLAYLSEILLPLQNIQFLNLSYNLIEQWDTSNLTTSTDIKLIDLTSNNITHFRISLSLPELEYLYLGNNEYLKFDLLFNYTGRNLGLTYAVSSQPYDAKKVAQSLKYLDLSNSNQNIISEYLRTKYTLRVYNISNNIITKLVAHDFVYLSPNLTIDLSFNNITTIFLKDNEIRPVLEDEVSGVNMYMDSKSLICDCSLFTVFMFHQSDITILHEQTNVANISTSSLMCDKPSALSGKYVEVSEEWSLHSLTLLGLCLL